MRYLIGFLLISSFLLSCDKVEDPYAHIEEEIDVDIDSTFNDTTYNDTTIVQTKRILIEDFTGHLCPNCPKGTDIAKAIVADYPEQVFLIAIHNSSNFSKPNPDKGFPANFETEAGENLRIKFKIGSFPNGLINRIDFSNGAAQTRAVGIDLWRNTVEGLIQDAAYMEQDFSMQVMNIYNTDSRVAQVFPTITCEEDQTGDFYAVVYILENGIVSPQEDNRQTPPIIEDYVHNEMLRGAFPQNGDGTLVFSNPIQGETYADTQNPIEFIVEEDWVAEQCDLVVLIYSTETDEVVHAEKLPLTSE